MATIKVKTIMLDEFNLSLLEEAINSKIAQCLTEKNLTAEANYQTLLADIKDTPFESINTMNY